MIYNYIRVFYNIYIDLIFNRVGKEIMKEVYVEFIYSQMFS